MLAEVTKVENSSEPKSPTENPAMQSGSSPPKNPAQSKEVSRG